MASLIMTYTTRCNVRFILRARITFQVTYKYVFFTLGYKYFLSHFHLVKNQSRLNISKMIGVITGSITLLNYFQIQILLLLIMFRCSELTGSMVKHHRMNPKLSVFCYWIKW